jgi:hypothetical protein
MKKYLIKMKSAEIGIMTLLNNTVESEIAKWANASDVESYREISNAEIPSDREFRSAWRDGSTSITFDLNVAKNTQLEQIREARKPKLDALDIKYMLADEQNNAEEKARIASEKQRFRDITEPLKALSPSSIDEIKNAFPDSLLEFK